MTEEPTSHTYDHNRLRKGPASSGVNKLPWNPDGIAQFSQALLAANSLDEVVRLFPAVIDLGDRSGIAILIVGSPPNNGFFEVAAAYAERREPTFPDGMRLDIQENLLRPLWRTHQSIVINDIASYGQISEYLRSVLLQRGKPSLVMVPLKTGPQLLGALVIDRYETQLFEQKDLHICEAAASIAEGAIEKLWRIRQQERAFSKTSALYTISQRLLEAQTINDILQNVVESQLFGAAGGTIALLEPRVSPSGQTEQELVFWAAAGAGSDSILGLRMPVTEGVVGWVVRENQPALVPDAYDDERFYRQVDQDIDFRTHSILCTPLRVEDRVIGAIELVDVRPEALTDEGMRLLGQVADQAALLIENQRLLEETRRQTQELSLLLDVSHGLTTTMEMQETLHFMSSRVLDLVKATACHVFLRQSEPDGEDVLTPVVSNDRYAQQILDTPLRLGQGITGRVAESGRGVIANRVDLDPRGFAVPGTPREPENLIAVPLVSEGRHLGVMTVSRLGEEGFIENDLKVVSAIANQAATVLEKARLFKEAQQRSQELATLNAVISTASQSMSVPEILKTTLERITEVIPGSAGLIGLFNADRDELELAAHQNFPSALAERYQRDGMRQTLCHITANKAQVYAIPDLALDASLSGQSGGVGISELVAEGLRAYLGTPLIAHGRILGTLSVFINKPNSFTPAEVGLLTALGQQVGIAVRNAQLFAQIEHALEESTALYQASEAISNTLELEDVLKITVQRLIESVGVDQCRVVLFDKTMGFGQVMAEHRPTQKMRVVIKGNLLYEILRDRGQPISIEDVRTHPITQGNSGLLFDPNVQSALLIPLIVQGRFIGSVELESVRTRRSFSAAEINFCRALADRAALAVENRRLFSQTFFALQETTLLYQANRALTQATNLLDVLNAITDHLPVKQIDQCLIALLDADVARTEGPANRIYKISAMWDHEGDYSLLDRGFTGRELPILAQPEFADTRAVHDLDDETQIDPQSAATLHDWGVKSALIVPLVIGQVPLGWLMLLSHHHTHIFDPEQIRPYQALADQAAVVIRNQQLLQQVHESLEEVSTVHRQYLRDEWTRFLQAQDHSAAISFDQGEIRPEENLWHPLLEEALREGGPVTYSAAAPENQDHDPSGQRSEDADLAAGRSGEPRGGTSLVAPLKVRGQVIGAIGLEDPENARDWTPDELVMIQEISDRVAQAVENARLLEETQMSLTETERLYKATDRFSNAESADQVVRVLVEEVQSALGQRYTGAVLCAGPDPSDRIDWLEASAQWNADGIEIPDQCRFSTSDHSGFHHLFRQREPFVVNDIEETYGEALPQELLGVGHLSVVLAIPLVAGNTWLGLLNIISQEQRLPDMRTLRLLQNLAARAAAALESVRLYLETQQRALQLEAASKVSRAATSILEQDKLLSSVVELIRDHFDYYHAQVFLSDPAQRFAVLRASTGEVGKKLLMQKHALEIGGSSLVGYVTGTGEPRHASDVDADPIHSENPDLPNTRSELAIPLKIGGRVIGALDVQSIEPSAFGPDDIAVLSTLADQLAIAIENARLYQELLGTAEKLREMDRLKTQFMANMSHELRTPLNSIIGFSRVMLKGIDGPITELQKQDLTAIYDSGQLLLRLINDILDLSKIEAGKMELIFEETDLEEIIKSAISTTQALIKDKPGIQLRHIVASGLPAIIADTTRLRQVLLNLLSNAVKFTERGYVELGVSYDSDTVTIKVKDTGIGIPSDKLDVIFEEFEQVDGSTTRAVGGTGLGLPISRRFVEMHGGRLSVESRVGVGSIFTVELPRKGPEGSRQTTDELGIVSKKRLILAIEDDADVVKLYKRYLEKQDYDVVGLSKSELAVQKARELHPHAILLDLLMPGKDGWTIIQELKTAADTRDIPIIICSIVNAAGRGFCLGATDYLVKPIAEDQLLTALERLGNGADGDRTEPRQVLIIDDSPEDRTLLRRILESDNGSYDVVEAAGGLEGIEYIGYSRPDLVILDLMMPEMDGFAVIEALKKDTDMRRIPIIIVTAKELSERERSQLNGQVAALFQKGLFKEEELLQDLNHALRRIQFPIHPEHKPEA